MNRLIKFKKENNSKFEEMKENNSKIENEMREKNEKFSRQSTHI